MHHLSDEEEHQHYKLCVGLKNEPVDLDRLLSLITELDILKAKCCLSHLTKTPIETIEELLEKDPEKTLSEMVQALKYFNTLGHSIPETYGRTTRH
jgi:hypothetical protein